MIHESSEQGVRIVEFLKRELSMPDGLIGFTVSFQLNDVVRVVCEYEPKSLDAAHAEQADQDAIDAASRAGRGQ